MSVLMYVCIQSCQSSLLSNEILHSIDVLEFSIFNAPLNFLLAYYWVFPTFRELSENQIETIQPEAFSFNDTYIVKL